MKSPKLVVKRVPGFRLSGRFFVWVAALGCGVFVCEMASSYSGAIISNAASTYDSIPNAVPHAAAPDAVGVLSESPTPSDAVDAPDASPDSIADPEDAVTGPARARVTSLGQMGRGQPWGGGNGINGGPGGNGGRNNGGGGNNQGGGMFPGGGGGGGGNGQGGVYIAPSVRLSERSNDQLNNKRDRALDSLRPATNSFSD